MNLFSIGLFWYHVFTELDFTVLFLYKMFTSMFQVNNCIRGFFFLSASLVNKPCCFHSPYITLRFFLTLGKVLLFPMMLKRANLKLYGQAWSMCSSLQIGGMQRCKTICIRSQGPDLTVGFVLPGWASSYKYLVLVGTTYFFLQCTHMHIWDVHTCRCIGPWVCLHFVWEMELVI